MKQQKSTVRNMIMKQLVLFQMIFSFCFSLQAQDSIQKKRLLTPTIEISGGTGIALYNKDFKTGYHVQQDLLYATDLLVGLDFVEPYGTLSIQSGIILDNHDFAFKYYYSFWEERVESSHALFLNVPLSISYNHFIKENIAISASGTILFRKLIQYNCSSPCLSNVDLKSKDNRLTYGCSVAFGIQYHFSSHFSLHPQLYFAYYWGTNALERGNILSQDLAKISQSPIIGLKIGIKYNILRIR
mgnify:CR=1 FL=1